MIETIRKDIDFLQVVKYNNYKILIIIVDIYTILSE